MASVVITGDTSGSITLAAPAVAGSNTLTLPANTGTIITTASGSQSIPKAALPAGCVIQTVAANNTLNVTSLTSTSFITIGLTATITPTSSTSKICVYAVFSATQDNSDTVQSYVSFYRNNTTALQSASCNAMWDNPQGNVGLSVPLIYYDSPATTSATTYTVYARVGNSASSFRPVANTDTIILMEIAA